MAFSRAQRQAIVEDFTRHHNGLYDPKLFLREVEEQGEDHPAHEWFQWDDDEAAFQHRLWQARVFVSDLRIKFSVETIGRDGPLTIAVREMPFAFSPMSGRQDAGGYLVTDPENAAHRAEHTRQAATALRTWLRRYASVHPETAALVEQALESLSQQEADAA